MDNISIQEELNPKKKNQKSGVYRVIKFFLIILLILLGLVIRSFNSESKASQETINQIEEYAKQAVITSYNFEEGVSYQAYVDEICEISTASYCEQIDDVISQEQYTKLLTVTIQCELLSSEYMDTYKTSGKTIFVYRIKSQLLFDGYDDILENDDAVIMTDENGWKMMNLMDYDEFVELINQD
jgi:hypothetical protein